METMYLATTALSEFWDKKQKILFLGPWCLVYNKQEKWKNLDYIILENPWNNREQFYEAGIYTEKIYEKYLKKLTLLLNETHEVNFNENYWRIVIGTWLFQYIEALYDRYCHIRKAFYQYPDLETWLLSPNQYITPASFVDFTYLYTEDDWYNLQLYSQIIREIHPEFPIHTERYKKGGLNKNNLALTSFKKKLYPWKKYIFKNILQFACWLKQEPRIVITDIHISLKNLLYFIFLNQNCIYFSGTFPESLLHCEYDAGKRKNLFESLKGYDEEFERILVKSFSVNFPALYLEGYHKLRDFTKKKTKHIPYAVLSSVGWYFNEGFKFYAAEMNHCGAMLFGYQHGGGYGQSRNVPPEKHEIRINNIFYTWGWESKDFPSKTKHLPKPSELKPRDKTRDSSNTKDILFICTNHPRYLYYFNSCPVGSQFDEYIEDEKRFVREIEKELYLNFIIRLYPSDYQRNIKERITAEFPDLRFDVRKNYLQSLKKARVVVVDHLATTFLIALASNIPTVLFWNPRYWEVRSSAQPYFDKLRRVGILHDTPESAAAKVNEIYKDTDAWWYKPEIQKAKNEFCLQFARTSENWLKEWRKELLNATM